MSTKLPSMFDATTVQPSGVGGQLPIGEYPVVIVSGDVVPTKDNTGGLAELHLSIIDGPHKGGSGVYRLNLFNQSTKAAEIAQKQLSALCHVTNTFQIDDLQALFNKPFVVVVNAQKNDDKYTEVVGVKDMQGNAPGKQSNGAAAASATAPVAAAPVAAAAPAAAGWGAAPAAAEAPSGASWTPGGGGAVATAAPWGAR